MNHELSPNHGVFYLAIVPIGIVILLVLAVIFAIGNRRRDGVKGYNGYLVPGGVLLVLAVLFLVARVGMMREPLFLGIVGISAVIAVLMLGVRFYQGYAGVNREGGYLLALATLILSIGAGIYVANELDDRPYHPPGDVAFGGFMAGLLVLAGIPLMVKLYRGWIGGRVSEAEAATGAAGVRAWLSPTSLLLAVCVAGCAAEGFGYSFVGVLLLMVLALVAYPLMRTLGQPGAAAAVASPAGGEAENLTAEREKVLALLEAGRITAEESAELLNALGSTVRTAERARVGYPAEERVLLLGAALVLVGFFLPWFTINVGQEMARRSDEIQGQMNQFAGQFMQPGQGMSAQAMIPSFGQIPGMDGGSLNISGGDVKHGLGWMVLMLSAGVAALPLMGGRLDAQTRRMATLLGLGAGTVLLGYLVTGSVRFINVGVVLAGAGYAAQWVGVLKRGGGWSGVGAGIVEHA